MPMSASKIEDAIEATRCEKTQRRYVQPPRLDTLKSERGNIVCGHSALDEDPDLQELGTNVFDIQKSAAAISKLMLEQKAQTDQFRSVTKKKLAYLAEVVRKFDTVAIKLRDQDEVTDASDVLHSLQCYLREIAHIHIHTFN